MELIIAFGFGMVAAGVAIYIFMCVPDARENYNAGYEAGVLDTLNKAGENDADNSL